MNLRKMGLDGQLRRADFFDESMGNDRPGFLAVRFTRKRSATGA